MSAAGGALGRTARAFRDAGREVRIDWSPLAWLVVAALVVAALVPIVLPSSVGTDGLADTGYLALAAVGLGFAVGIGGIPSLAQGAFVGVGAITAAHAVDAGPPPLAAALLGAALAAVGGLVVGLGLARLRPVYVVAATWLATWLLPWSGVGTRCQSCLRGPGGRRSTRRGTPGGWRSSSAAWKGWYVTTAST